MRKVMILAPLALLLAVAVVVGARTSIDDGDRASGSPEVGAMQPTDQPAGGAVEAASAGIADVAADHGQASASEGSPPVVEVAAQLPGIEQRVVQTAMLSVTVPKGDFDEVVNTARSIATGLGGFVTSSSASQGADERLVHGSLVVRVPQQAYARAMTALSDLGTVKGRQESGEDVSLRYVDLEAKARHLESVERQLLSLLDKTTTVADALVVQQQLNEVQLQLEQVRGELRYLESQTAYATITLEVAERGIPVVPAERNGWGLADAWASAAHGFEKVIGGILVALVTAGPILLALGAAFALWRLHLRRRRVAAATGAGPAQTPAGG